MISHGKEIFLNVNVVAIRFSDLFPDFSPQVIDTGIRPSVQLRIAELRVTALPEKCFAYCCERSSP
jgi:hypothetical protein